MDSTGPEIPTRQKKSFINRFPYSMKWIPRTRLDNDLVICNALTSPDTGFTLIVL